MLNLKIKDLKKFNELLKNGPQIIERIRKIVSHKGSFSHKDLNDLLDMIEK